MQTKPPSSLSPLPEDGGGSPPDGGHRRILSATAIVMAGVLLSRLLGLVRDRVIAHQFGQGTQTDIYNAAFTIPDLINNVIAGGALASAFIPVFTEYMQQGKKGEAWRIFSFVAYATVVVVSALVLFGEIQTPWLVHIFNSGWDPGKPPDAFKIAQTVTLTRILLPAQLCFFLGGLMMSALQVRNNFLGQAFGPVIYNLGIILGGLFLAQPLGVAGLCWGAVGGALVGNLVLQWALVLREGGHFTRRNIWELRKHPGVIEIGKVMLPILLLLSLPQVSAIVNKYFASYLGEGIQSALMNANRLMQLPLGLFAQAYGIAIFPTLSVHAANKDHTALRRAVNSGLRFILFLTVPSSLLMMVLAMPIVQLILQTGKFHTADSRVTANLLIYYSIGIFAWSSQAILGRGFYSLKNSRTPMVVGTIVTVIFVLLNAAALRWVGIEHPNRAAAGLALVTSLSAILNMFILLVLLRRRLGGIEGIRLIVGTGKILIASGLTSLVCYLLLSWMTQRYAGHGSIVKQSGMTLLVCLSVSVAVYGVLAFLLRMEETRLLKNLFRKLRRRAAPAE